jgi:mRNA interferase MazF
MFKVVLSLRGLSLSYIIILMVTRRGIVMDYSIKKTKLKEIFEKCRGYDTINEYLDKCSIISEFRKTLSTNYPEYFYLDKLTIQKLVTNAPSYLDKEQLTEELFLLTEYVNKTTEILRGQIYWVDFGKGIGSEQSDHRPALVVQNNIGNKKSSTIVVIAITTNTQKAYLPVHVLIELIENTGLSSDSVVLAEQVRTVDKKRVGDYIGECPYYLMQKINKAIKIELDLYKEVDIVEFTESFADSIKGSIKFRINHAKALVKYLESNGIDYKNNVDEYVSHLRFQYFNDIKRTTMELHLAKA